MKQAEAICNSGAARKQKTSILQAPCLCMQMREALEMNQMFLKLYHGNTIIEMCLSDGGKFEQTSAGSGHPYTLAIRI